MIFIVYRVYHTSEPIHPMPFPDPITPTLAIATSSLADPGPGPSHMRTTLTHNPRRHQQPPASVLIHMHQVYMRLESVHHPVCCKHFHNHRLQGSALNHNQQNVLAFVHVRPKQLAFEILRILLNDMV